MAEFTIWDSCHWDEDYCAAEWQWDELTEDMERVSGNWVVFGTLGLWDGPRKVWATGKLIDLVRKCIDNMDYITITENERGKVTITCQHHDGTNIFELCQLPYSGNYGTEKQMRKHSTNGRLRKALGWI